MAPLSLVEQWPVPTVAAATIDFDGTVEVHGDIHHSFRLASIAKIVTALAVLVAVEEGSISLETPVGQPGCTVRHLLSHAGGYGFEGAKPISAPGRRRIYSNTGIELAAHAVAAATGIDFGSYVAEAVLQPLAMSATKFHGSPAHAVWSNVDDMVKLAREWIHPTLVAAETLAAATSPQFGDLAGVIPGLGSFNPCPWGLGPEIRGTKRPHWMGATNSEEAFGHFGGAGTMMWIDPIARIGLIALTDRMFDDWAVEALRLWPMLSEAVVAASPGAGSPEPVQPPVPDGAAGTTDDASLHVVSAAPLA